MSVLSRRNLIVAALTVGVSLTAVHPSWAADVMHHALPTGDRPHVEQAATTTTVALEPSTTEVPVASTTTELRREEPTTVAPVVVEATTEPTPPATEPRHEPTTTAKPPTTEPKHEPTTEPKHEPTTEETTATTVHHEETHAAATFELRCERVAGDGGARVVCRWRGDAPDGFSRFALGRSSGDGPGRIVYTSDDPARREGTDSTPIDGPASYTLFALNGDGKAIGHSQIVSV